MSDVRRQLIEMLEPASAPAKPEPVNELYIAEPPESRWDTISGALSVFDSRDTGAGAGASTCRAAVIPRDIRFRKPIKTLSMEGYHRGAIQSKHNDAPRLELEEPSKRESAGDEATHKSVILPINQIGT